MKLQMHDVKLCNLIYLMAMSVDVSSLVNHLEKNMCNYKATKTNRRPLA